MGERLKYGRKKGTERSSHFSAREGKMHFLGCVLVREMHVRTRVHFPNVYMCERICEKAIRKSYALVLLSFHIYVVVLCAGRYTRGRRLKLKNLYIRHRCSLFFLLFSVLVFFSHRVSGNFSDCEMYVYYIGKCTRLCVCLSPLFIVEFNGFFVFDHIKPYQNHICFKKYK